MATTQQTCSVKCESYTNSIIPRIYEHLIRGSMGDCTLSAEGKFIRAHKLILSISSDYFESIFNIANMEKPVIVLGNLKFADLCLILDFAYLGQAQVPSDRLEDFLRAGESLRIRGIKEGRIHYLNNMDQTTIVNRSFDATISSTQQETVIEPSCKQAREDDDISTQENTEILKILLENNTEIDVDHTTQARASVTNQTNYNINKVTPEKPKFLCRFCSRALTTKGRIKKHENECASNPNRAIAICDVCNEQLKPSLLSDQNDQQKTFNETTTEHITCESSSQTQIVSYVDQTQTLISYGPEMSLTTQNKKQVSSLFGLPVDQTQMSFGSEMTSSMQNLQVSTQQKTFNETTTEYITCESSPRTQSVSYVDQTQTLISYGPEMSLTTQNKKQVSSIFGLPKYARVGKQDKNVDIFGIIQSGPLVMTSDVQPKKVKATSLKTIDSHNILNATSLAKPKSIRNKHVGTSPVKAVCRFCSKQFKNVDQLNLHERCCQFNPNRSHNRCPICKIEVRMDLMTYHNRVYH